LIQQADRQQSVQMREMLAFGMPAAPEWIFISILALVLFGPKKLPELARGVGKALGELQKAKEEFHREITGVPQLPKIQSQEGLQPSIPKTSAELPAPGESKTDPHPAPSTFEEGKNS
jgi:TatA/E family protein of Tat protein translocase